jgi:hypothetical protein
LALDKAPATLKEGRETLEAKNTALESIFTEAAGGSDPDTGAASYDYSQVKSIDGDAKAVKDEIEKRLAEISDLHDWVVEQQAAATAHSRLQKGLDVGRDPAGPVQHPAADPRQDVPEGQLSQKSLSRLFGELMGANEALAEAKSLQRPISFELPVDARTMKANFLTTDGWAPQNLRTGRIAFAATREGGMVLPWFPTSPTNQAAVVYMAETITTPAAAERAEAAAYAEAVISYAETSENVRMIGVSIPITDEQVEDVPSVQALLENRLTMLELRRLDLQLLVGDGVAPNLRGTNNVVGIQTQALGVDPRPDAMSKLFTSIRSSGFAEPSVSFWHPNDWENLRLLRTADGLYIFGPPNDPTPPRIWGVPVVETTAATENTVTAGDYATHAEVRIRRGIVVEVGLDSDDFTTGMKHIRVGIRLAIVHYRAAAFGTATGM